MAGAPINRHRSPRIGHLSAVGLGRQIAVAGLALPNDQVSDRGRRGDCRCASGAGGVLELERFG
jgi:hypothetical protein